MCEAENRVNGVFININRVSICSSRHSEWCQAQSKYWVSALYHDYYNIQKDYFSFLSLKSKPWRIFLSMNAFSFGWIFSWKDFLGNGTAETRECSIQLGCIPECRTLPCDFPHTAGVIVRIRPVSLPASQCWRLLCQTLCINKHQLNFYILVIL